MTDKIRVEIEQKELVADAVAKYAGYIASQTLAVEVKAAAQPAGGVIVDSDRKSTRLNSSHNNQSRMPSSA